MQLTTFTCSWDGITWKNTLLPVTIVFITTLILVLAPIGKYVKCFILLNNIVAIILPFIFSPTRYTVQGNCLIVHKPIFKDRIYISQICQTRILDRSEFQIGLRRIMGSGGLFGFYGTFKNNSLGEFTSYVTRQDRVVALCMDNHKIYVLSPDDIEGFLTLLWQNRPKRPGE